MRKMIKLAIGVAVLGFVGLIGLSTMSMLWAIAAPHPRHHEVAMEQVPALAVDRREIDRAVRDAIKAEPALTHPVEVRWDQPARVQINVHESWMDGAESFTGIIILFGLPAIIFIVILAMRRRKSAKPSDETALVHELARRAQDLAQRMEALETILLDRTRATR